MSFLLAAAAVGATGYALLRVLRLGEGRPSVDVPLAWLVGSAWVGFASFTARGLLGVPSGAPAAIAVLALPLAAWGAMRGRGGWGGHTSPGVDMAGGHAARGAPRPAWLFVPLAAWTVAVAGAVLLHGLNTPVHTDDAYRVRALAPVLAATGAWNGAAREVIAMAGPIPTYVPALAWTLGAAVDPVHVSAAIGLTFLSLLALLVSLGSTRGMPEAGWGAAFGIASMPFFAYHAASTYADAWLGMYLAAGFAFLVAHGRGGGPADAGRSALLLLGAAMVKREGEMLALPMLGVLLVQVALVERPGWSTLRRIGVLLGAWSLVVAARVGAIGLAGAFPFVRAAAERAGGAVPAAAVPAAGTAAAPAARAGSVFVRAVFADGELGILWWAVLASLVLLLPRVRPAGLVGALVALAVAFAQTLASAVWLYPQFTVNHATVHRSLLPVSAAAAVWLAWLLADACRPVTGAVPPAPPVRPGAGARRRSREAPRRRGG